MLGGGAQLWVTASPHGQDMVGGGGCWLTGVISWMQLAVYEINLKKSFCQLKKGIICLSLAADSSCSQNCPGWVALGHCSSAPLLGGTEGQICIEQTGLGFSCCWPYHPWAPQVSLCWLLSPLPGAMSLTSLPPQPRVPELPAPFPLDEPDEGFQFSCWSGPSSNPFRGGWNCPPAH